MAKKEGSMAKKEGSYTLPKTERLHSKKLIDSLFGGSGSKSMSAFPIRMVYKPQPPITGKKPQPPIKGEQPSVAGEQPVLYDKALPCPPASAALPCPPAPASPCPPASQLLVSVPKRCLHRANKRNTVKRQIREAYRKNKHIIDGLSLTIAFIWLDNKLYDSATIERQVVNLLTRAKEKNAQQ